MEKKIVYLSVILIVLLGVLSLLILKLSNNEKSLSPSSLFECKTLSNSGEFKITVIGNKEVSSRYMNSLLSIEPYSSNKEKFSFSYIDNYNYSCDLYKDIALNCYSKELVKTVSKSCKSDLIIVSKNYPTKVRSSAYLNVLSINENHQDSVIAHEFAHSFAALSDEYVPADIRKNSKNCVSECKAFNQEECFKGCSKEEYYRSIDMGLMKTLSVKDYGSFNENLILEKINKIKLESSKLTGNAIYDKENCEEEYFLLSFNISNDSFSYVDRTIESGCLSFNSNNEGEINYTLLTEDNQKLFEESFNPFIIYTDSHEENSLDLFGGSTAYEGEFYLKVPIIEEKEIFKLNHQNISLTIPLILDNKRNNVLCEIK